MRVSLAGLLGLPVVVTAVACGASPIRVVGVVRESPEMRPLQNVQVDAYKQLHVLVRPAASPAEGTSECGSAPLEGTTEGEDKKNLACVPADATNDAVRLVRQRLRAYGVPVARDATEPYDYTLEVRLTGQAPRRPDPMLAKVLVRLAFTLRADDATNGYFQGIDMNAATAAFAAVARDCGIHEGDLRSFSVASTQPMNPELDVASVSADGVDNSLGCAEMGRFFRDAHTRFPAVPAAPATAP
jgi:hypothetical protein